MGLILSILVSFVGVFELLAFYNHLRRGLTTQTENGDLTIVKRNYVEMLAKKYTLNLQGDPGQSRNTSNYSLRTSPKAVVIGEPRNDLSDTTIIDDTSMKASTSKETYTIIESPTKKTLKHHKSEFFEDSRPHQSGDRLSPTVEKIYLGEEVTIDPIHGKRSSSPFPTYERMKPRGSICELVENPTINVTEVDEDESEHASASFWTNSKRGSRSRSPSPRRKRAINEEHKSAEYYGVNLAVRRKKNRSVSPEPKSDDAQKEPRRSRSFSNTSRPPVQISDLAYQIVDKDYWSRSPSPFKEFLDDDKRFRLVFDERFKDSLDGVKEDLKRNYRKKCGRKEEKVDRMLTYKEDEFLEPFQEAVTPTSSAEKFAGEMFSNKQVVCGGKSVDRRLQDEQKPSTSRGHPEPFWVK